LFRQFTYNMKGKPMSERFNRDGLPCKKLHPLAYDWMGMGCSIDVASKRDPTLNAVTTVALELEPKNGVRIVAAEPCYSGAPLEFTAGQRRFRPSSNTNEFEISAGLDL